MTSPSATCPSNWTTHSLPRGCGRDTSNTLHEIQQYLVGGVSFSSVCGRILAYIKGSTLLIYQLVDA